MPLPTVLPALKTEPPLLIAREPGPALPTVKVPEFVQVLPVSLPILPAPEVTVPPLETESVPLETFKSPAMVQELPAPSTVTWLVLPGSLKAPPMELTLLLTDPPLVIEREPELYPPSPFPPTYKAPEFVQVLPGPSTVTVPALPKLFAKPIYETPMLETDPPLVIASEPFWPPPCAHHPIAVAVANGYFPAK